MLQDKPAIIFLFRILGIALVAVVVLVVPDVGPNRYWLVGALLGVHLPLALWMHAKLSNQELGWVEPLVDLSVCVVFIHLVPQYWHTGLVIGLMVALAPSISSTTRSYQYYVLMALILVVGFSLAGFVHDVDGWGVPMLAIIAVLPAVLFYAYLQAQSADTLRQRAQSLSTLNQVAGGVAHDFNNLLTGVLGHAELALLDLSADHPARQSLEEVISGANRASMLSGQLLAFSRHGLRTEDVFSLADEIQIITSLLKTVIPKGVTLSLDVADSLPNMKGQRGELQQVIMNIILNAAEASDDIPSVVTVHISRDPELADSLIFVVKDRGKGIAKEHLKRILDASFSTKLRGHGLGLSSAKRIVEAHRGSIDVQSEQGQGTVVTLRLPGVRDAITNVANSDARQVSNSSTRVLVIEDDASVRKVISRLLETLGFRASLAEDGPAGLALLENLDSSIDKVILDLNMPGMDGWECLDRIRMTHQELPVLICSGYDPDEQQSNLSREGVSFLQKPFTLDKLRTALASLS